MAWRDRIRELVGAGVLIAGVTTAATFAPGTTTTAAPDVIRIANFNIQVFGKTKSSNAQIMDVLARVAREFDVMAIEEVRDADRLASRRLLDWINQDAEVQYAMIEGPRLGRTSSKEQYVIYYKPAFVTFVDSFTVPDPDDRFERPPLVARFAAGTFDFRLVISHVKPDDAFDEMAALADVVDAIVDSTEGDVITLGDLNADCSYFRESDPHPFRTATYHWVIADNVQTAVKTNCTYDRIVLRDGTFGSEYVPNSAQVFRFDDAFALSDRDFVERVSDHYPVFAEYRTTGPDDDGPTPTSGLAAVSVTPAAVPQFVASSRGRLYYLAGCNAARRLSPVNLVTFASEQAAQQAGYRRSTAKGC